MTRLTIAAGLILMLCATGLAQEREERERDNQDRPREKARGARERDNQDRSRSKVPGARRDRRKRVDWEAEYQKFLKENPGVKRAVENGRIAKEKVLAEIKDRAAEKAREAASEEEQILEREFQQLIKERPGLAEQIKAGEIKKEAVMQRLRIGRQRRRGPARDDQERPAARRGRAVGPAQVALRSKLGELVRAGKLTRAEAGELYQIAFPENVRRPARADRDGARDPEGDRDGARDPEGDREGARGRGREGARGRGREGARSRDREDARDRDGARGRGRAGSRPGARPRRERRRPSRQELIKQFDKDGDGKLNDDESRAALRALRDAE